MSESTSSVTTSGDGSTARAFRVLYLTDYFPSPANPTAATWALAQARMIALGAEVRVVVMVPWVPRWLAFTGKAKKFASFPRQHDYENVRVIYPRWPYYFVGPLMRLYVRYPALIMGPTAMFLRPFLSRLVRNWKPDVVFAHHCATAGVIATWLKRRFGVPFVTEDHDFGSVEICREFSNRRRAFARSINQAAFAIGPAKRIASSISALFPQARTKTLPNGTYRLSAEILGRPRPADRAAKFVVFSACMFYGRKGIVELVEAFVATARNHPEMIMRIAGDGVLRPQVEAAIAASGLADRITLLGLVPHSQIQQEMVWSDVFMLIGWDEPFATVFIEAMAAGKPVICCNDGGIMDVLRDNVHGFAVPPHDIPAAAAALEKLYAEPATRQRMGRSAHDLFESQLSFERVSQATLGLLHEAASMRAGGNSPAGKALM